MATDFTNNNTTINTGGGLQPKTRNTPLDVRTRVNLKADIDSIPNPFVGMKIIVLQDETNDNQMTEYVVVSLKANSLGIADSKVNQVVLVKDFLGVSGASGSGMTSEQAQQLNAAYTHSQSTHVQQSDIPTRIGQLENDSGFITEIPNEYITETELNTKGFATETFVTNKIAEASLNGGEVDLSGLGADLSLNGQTLKLKNSNGQEIGTGVTLPQTSSVDAYTKTETDNLIQDYTGGKKQVYLTQAEYDLLSTDEKNDSSKVYNITDAVEQVTPTDLTINSNNLLQLKDANGNAIGTGVTVSTTSGGTSYTLPTASSTTLGGIKVGDRLSIDSNGVLSADIQESTPSTPSNELILTSPSGYRFKVIVNDEGVLSTEEIVTLGNIIASVSELSINEGESATFTISLSETPTRAQTITIASNNTDVTVNPSSIDISDTNPHTITVTTLEDEDYDDDIAILTLSSSNVPNVTINVTVVDNDISGGDTSEISIDDYIFKGDFTNNSNTNLLDDVSNYDNDVRLSGVTNWADGVMTITTPSGNAGLNTTTMKQSIETKTLSIELCFKLNEGADTNPTILNLSVGKISGMIADEGTGVYTTFKGIDTSGSDLWVTRAQVKNLNMYNYTHIVYTATTTEINVYVNGVLDNTVNLNDKPTLDHWLVSHIQGYYYKFTGDVKCFNIYNKVLTSEQVASLYNNYSS